MMPDPLRVPKFLARQPDPYWDRRKQRRLRLAAGAVGVLSILTLAAAYGAATVMGS